MFRIDMNKPYFSLYEIVLMSLMGALVFISRSLIDIDMHFPGHTGIFWVLPVILGAGIVNKPGSGSYIGLISGLLASFFGMGGFHIFDILKYFALGITVDVIGLPFKGHLADPLAGFIVGASANFIKMLVNYLIHMSLGIPSAFILIGIGFSSVSHIVFGGLGGVIAAVILGRLYRSGVVKKDG